jgi:hypothetical protein
MCNALEWYADHLQSTMASLIPFHSCAAIGLLFACLLLVLYFSLDQWVYRDEFRSIWTPYIFVLIVSIDPLIEQIQSSNLDHHDHYFQWLLAGMTALMICIRLLRRVRSKRKAWKNRPITLEIPGGELR